MKKHAISFDQVYKSFGKIQALNGISFSISQGSVTGLIGSNGSGKTTTIKCMLNFYDDYIGEIHINGKDSRGVLSKENIISYIPDRPIFYEELTVNEHFKFISAMYKTEDKIQPLIDMFSLGNHINKFPHELSKGTAQKLLIGCGLLRKFDILIADEPFEGLDPKQIIELKNIFKQLKREGTTVVVSTHLLSVIESICDDYVMLDQGDVIGYGDIHSILDKTPNCSNLEELYLYLSEGSKENAD